MQEKLKVPWVRVGVDFWFDRATWSAYMAFVLMSGLVLWLLLPTSQHLSEIKAAPSDMVLFPAFFIILYGILAMTLGQAEFDWQPRLGWPEHLLHLLCRQLLALFLTLPYWLVFLVAHSIHPLMGTAIFLYLGLYGWVLGLFGLRLALTQRSEIFQFNLKYLSFFAFLVVSFFVPGINYLNPVGPLQSMLGEGSLVDWLPIAARSSLLWGVVGMMFVVWIRHGFIQRREDPWSRPI